MKVDQSFGDKNFDWGKLQKLKSDLTFSKGN